jgi:hypothetical protein
LRNASWCRGDGREGETSEARVVASELTLALKGTRKRKERKVKEEEEEEEEEEDAHGTKATLLLPETLEYSHSAGCQPP